MDIRSKLSKKFKEVNGGLFNAISKADVGNVADEMTKSGISMLSWADPFMPDCVMPEVVMEACIKEFKNGNAGHYTTPIGNHQLKIEIAKKLKTFNKIEVDPERNILITPGSDSGLLFAMMPFIEEGDEVMVTDPSYPSNFLNPKLLGGVTISVPLNIKDNFNLEIEEFEKRLTPKTKMILLTNPNNPSTTVFSKEELIKLSEFAIKHDLVLVVDQAFEDSVFDDVEFVSAASLPGMWERTVTVCSISKGMGLSGLRVGYLVACDKVMDVLYGSAVNVIGATNTASQHGAIAAFKNSEFVTEYTKIFDRRRKYVYQALNSLPGVKMLMPESAFLAWVNISKLGTSDEIVQYLIEEAKVFVNAGTSYGPSGEGYIRIVFGCYKDDKVLYQAIDRIKCALFKKALEKNIK